MRDACEQAWSCYSAVMADWLRSSASPRCASLVLSMMFGSTRVRLTKLVLCLTTPPHQSALLTVSVMSNAKPLHPCHPQYLTISILSPSTAQIWLPVFMTTDFFLVVYIGVDLGAHVGNAGSILACALPPIIYCFLYCFIVNNIFKISFSN